MERPTLGWTVPSLIPKPGFVILMGPPKLGKSYLALQIALAVAQGREVFGVPVGTPKKVLYLQFDTSEVIWRERILELEDQGISIDGVVDMVNPEVMRLPINIANKDDQLWLLDVLHQSSPDLVIIDVIREIHTAQENDSTEMKYVSDCMTRIFGQYSVIAIHHTRKVPCLDIDNPPDPYIVARGSSYITGKADAYWLLIGTEQFGYRLSITSRFDHNQLLVAERESCGFWSFPGVAIPKREQKAALVLSLCDNHPTSTHLQIFDMYKDSLLKANEIGKSLYYRLLSSHECQHKRDRQAASAPYTAP